MGGFELPQVHSWPPFFTLQPVLSTRMKQLQLWRDLILQYCRHHALYRVAVADAASGDHELFSNKSINRRLDAAALTTIVDEMALSGHAEWVDAKKKSAFWVFWRPLQEWSDVVGEWVAANALHDSVCTVYELHSGDMGRGSPMEGVEHSALVRILEELEKSKRAQLIRGASTEEDGVKFL